MGTKDAHYVATTCEPQPLLNEQLAGIQVGKYILLGKDVRYQTGAKKLN